MTEEKKLNKCKRQNTRKSTSQPDLCKEVNNYVETKMWSLMLINYRYVANIHVRSANEDYLVARK